MPKDTFYFSHDYNARNDRKVKQLIAKHGYEGYGIFWAIVEDLYNNANAMRTDYDCIAFDMRTDCEVIRSIINDYELFEISGDFFRSASVQKRLDERKDKSIKASKSAQYRWGDANALRTESDSNAIKERKGKESTNNNNNLKVKQAENGNEKKKVVNFRAQGEELYAELHRRSVEAAKLDRETNNSKED